MELDIQEMRLMVWGAICLYEGQGLEIGQLLQDQGRDDLLIVLDAVMTALYWLQDVLAIDATERA